MIPRLVAYGAASTILAGGVISSALHTRANFYAAAVAIGRSSGALMVLANFALFNTICLGITLKKIFFGQLRTIEYEHLFERLWMFLTESLLALTIFRDDFSAPFAFMYGLLLFLKCFHWITADRVDYMDQIPPPGPAPIFHIRMTSIIFLLTAFDLLLVAYSLETILLDGVSAMVLFASEFTILLASISGTALRYGVNLVDLRRARGRADAPSWEEKSMWLFYVDLGVDFVKLLTYLIFFTVILLHYGLPLHILRDVYMTMRSFLSRCGDLIRYRRATRDMDALYPDATNEELDRLGDRTCIICREEMVPRGHQQDTTAIGGATDMGAGVGGPNETPKKLACGHVFHFHCLRSWLERQQSCPTCRRDVLRPQSQETRRRPGIHGNRANPAAPPAPAAAAAPGAIPQPNANANANGGIDPTALMRQNFEDYFRLPQPQPPMPAPTAAPANANSDTNANATTTTTEEDRRVQRGIWGGQVIPGRFFPAPLGAAPRLPSSYTRSVNVQRSTPTTTSTAGATTTATTSQNTNSTSPDQSPSGTGEGPSTMPNPINIPIPLTPQLDSVSGSTTPFSSQAPTVFSSTGEARRSDGDDNARKAAAEAAMRRLGLGLTAASESGKLALTPTLTSTRHVESKGQGKGKGKEKATTTTEDDWEKIPTKIPFLTLSDTELTSHSTASQGQEEIPLDLNVRDFDLGTKEQATIGLEERLKVLRQVDEVVWGLVGELSRLKSGWEAQDRQSQSTSTSTSNDAGSGRDSDASTEQA